MNSKTIEFEKIDEKIEIEKFNLLKAHNFLSDKISIYPLVDAAQDFQIIDLGSAKNALSMSLQARKLRQNLDKTRAEIVRPHYDFQKAINKLAKSFEEKLQEIEDSLSSKIEYWIEENKENEMLDMITQNISVEDGSMCKKKKWLYDIENKTLIPKEYLIVDEKKIQNAIKAGIRNIKGVKIYEKTEIEMRVKN